MQTVNITFGRNKELPGGAGIMRNLQVLFVDFFLL